MLDPYVCASTRSPPDDGQWRARKVRGDSSHAGCPPNQPDDGQWRARKVRVAALVVGVLGGCSPVDLSVSPSTEGHADASTNVASLTGASAGPSTNGTGGIPPITSDGPSTNGTGGIPPITTETEATTFGASLESSGERGSETSAGEPSTGGMLPTDGDGCNIGVFDPGAPPEMLMLSGDLHAHDPLIVRSEDLYYAFMTGDGIRVKTSPDLRTWTQQREVFPETPVWFQERVPEYIPRNVWSPDVIFFGNTYHLYYTVSSLGSNRSCIGHAVRPTLGVGDWTDLGDVVCSNIGDDVEDWNAIDSHVVLDEEGIPWMTMGGFWSVIKMVELTLDGTLASSDLFDVARRDEGAIGAPFIFRRCGYYYLFASFDDCCLDMESTYNIRFGRSESLRGPYVDRDGVAMLNGGGTMLVEADGDWIGPGHNAIVVQGTSAYNAYHAYSITAGALELRIAEIAWDAEGWPVSAGP